MNLSFQEKKKRKWTHQFSFRCYSIIKIVLCLTSCVNNTIKLYKLTLKEKEKRIWGEKILEKKQKQKTNCRFDVYSNNKKNFNSHQIKRDNNLFTCLSTKKRLTFLRSGIVNYVFLSVKSLLYSTKKTKRKKEKPSLLCMQSKYLSFL